jgi:hypothetical protein
MDKRLAKTHNRKVSRAKERVRLSEPDMRTEEQIKSAREASRLIAGRTAAPFRNNPPAVTVNTANTEVQE